MTTLHDILEHKGRAIHSTPASASMRDAVRAMCDARVGALLVLDDGQPIGIVSERDVLVRLVLEKRDPDGTRVEDIMTRDVVCIAVEATPEQAMSVMTERRCRHLPVVTDGRLVGVVSIGDLVRWTSRDHEFEIGLLRDYLAGRYP